MKSIIWLASYPKSGNTWLRAFLANYVFDRPEPVPINQVHRLGIGDAITKTYQAVSKKPFDPENPYQTLRLRERVLKGIVNNGADLNFVKTHNHAGSVQGTQLIPKRYTRGAIYILRNPLDVMISFANHYGLTLDHAIESSALDENVLQGHDDSAYQFLGTWSNHVLSWNRSRAFPVLVLRYEDMQTDPHDTFGRALEHIGLPIDAEKVDKAIRFSSFDELRKQEDRSGFVEKSKHQTNFFRSGASGQWKSILAQDQIDRIRAHHRLVMQTYGYL